MSLTSAALAETLRGSQTDLPHHLLLDIDGTGIAVRTNDQDLHDALAHYFRHVVVSSLSTTAKLSMELIERETLDLPIAFQDWSREPGKTGRKDSYVDLEDGRLLRKVKTGMVFLQSADLRIAAGPCKHNESQVINFINSQYLTLQQQNGWTICHAAACTKAGKALAFAGFSGGGKSTLMLHMMDDAEVSFMSNDRLLIKQAGSETQACGIPKLPRINPGTALNNDRLRSILSAERITELQSMPLSQLWDLEEKYDVDVAAVYGADRIQHAAPLAGLVILNWQREGEAPCQLQRVSLAQNRPLLRAVMKSPGPFHHDREGRHLPDQQPLSEDAYLAALGALPCYELTGKVNFAAATALCADLLASEG